MSGLHVHVQNVVGQNVLERNLVVAVSRLDPDFERTSVLSVVPTGSDDEGTGADELPVHFGP